LRSGRNTYRVVAAVLLLSGAYVGARLAWSQARTIPALEVDEQVRIVDRPFGYEPAVGVLTGQVVLEVDGSPVASAAEYRSAVRRAGGDWRRLLLRDANGVETALHWTYPRDFFLLEVDDALGVRKVTWGELDEVVGWRVTSINGEPVLDSKDYESRLRDYRVEAIRIELESASDDSRRAALYLYRLDWPARWVLWVVGCAFVAIGLFCYRLRADYRSSWGFLTFCSYMALFWLFRAIPFEYRTTIERHLFLAIWVLAPLPSVLFVGTFTPLRLVVRRLAPLCWAAALFGGALWTLNWVHSPEMARRGLLAGPEQGPSLVLLWAASLLGTIVLGASVDLMLRLARRRISAVDRQRARIVRLATVAGFAPITLWIIGNQFVRNFLDSGRLWIELTVLLFPLIIGYAVVRHNLLRLNQLVYEGVVYSALLFVVAVAYATLVGAVIPLVETFWPRAGVGVTSLFVVGVAMLANPIHTRVRSTIDSRYQRTSREFETFLGDVGKGARQVESGHAFCEQVVLQLGRIAGTLTVNLFIRHPPTEGWWLAAGTDPEVRARTDELQPLFDWMSRELSEISRESVADDLRQHPQWPPVLPALDAIRTVHAFPLIVHEELWGILCVGEKRNGTNYSSAEIEVLRRLSRQCGVGLYHYNLGLAEAGAVVPRKWPSIVSLYPDCPARIGPYAVERLIGEGASSLVFLGTGEGGRRVAIKVANRKVQGNDLFLKRFHREAEVMSALRHENLVEVFDVGFAATEPYFVMPYFPTGPLSAELRTKGALPVQEAITFLGDAVRGLSHALDHGVVHRDIKPHNLFRASPGRLKVGDFGLAKVIDDVTLTSQWHMMGTPAYLSPEVCRGEPADWRSDQYSLGVSFFELVSGRRPYRGAHVHQIIAMHLVAPLPELPEPRSETERALGAVLRTMMAKRREERFESYGSILARLGELAAA
jgi:hypothetical protein